MDVYLQFLLFIIMHVHPYKFDIIILKESTFVNNSVFVILKYMDIELF